MVKGNIQHGSLSRPDAAFHQAARSGFILLTYAAKKGVGHYDCTNDLYEKFRYSLNPWSHRSFTNDQVNSYKGQYKLLALYVIISTTMSSQSCPDAMRWGFLLDLSYVPRKLAACVNGIKGLVQASIQRVASVHSGLLYQKSPTISNTSPAKRGSSPQTCCLRVYAVHGADWAIFTPAHIPDRNKPFA